ncbi:MAG: peptide ABC transporter substrate-binding protein [Tissierellia bacterium]|nr:peptide ABC transporter substrate-binding protein [Tissierellia bacterium]
MLALALVLLLTACGGGGTGGTGGGGTEAEKVLYTNNVNEPGSLDPVYTQGSNEFWILSHAFWPLMIYDENSEVVPAAAENMEVSEDGLVYTFTLRDDMKWSNGDPVVAGDFEYAWKRHLDPEVASDYSFIITDYVLGAEEALAGTGAMEDVGIKALDDKTLEVTLKAPAAFFPGIVTSFAYYPVNEKIVSENPNWADDPNNTELVSNGPYKITSWAHNDEIIIEKNPEFYDADLVKIDKIYWDILEDGNTAYQKYENGEYDFLNSVPGPILAELNTKGDEDLKDGIDLGTYNYVLNHGRKPLNNVKVRKALALAIDRDTLMNSVVNTGEAVATGMVGPGFMEPNGKDFSENRENFVHYDPEEAKRLFEEGLAEEGMAPEDMNGMVISFNTSDNHRKIAQFVQEQWRQHLGIEVGMENMEFRVLLDKRANKDYDILYMGWLADYADPVSMLDIYMTGSGQNVFNYSNPEFDALVADAKTSTDLEGRMESLHKAEAILMEDQVTIPFYFFQADYLQKPYLTGVFKNSINYPAFYYADIEREQ